MLGRGGWISLTKGRIKDLLPSRSIPFDEAIYFTKESNLGLILTHDWTKARFVTIKVRTKFKWRAELRAHQGPNDLEHSAKTTWNTKRSQSRRWNVWLITKKKSISCLGTPFLTSVFSPRIPSKSAINLWGKDIGLNCMHFWAKLYMLSKPWFRIRKNASSSSKYEHKIRKQINKKQYGHNSKLHIHLSIINLKLTCSQTKDKSRHGP